MRDLTIVYVSSNQEDPKFEEAVRKMLLKNCGDLPIISVTQKPVNLGTNICVGEVGASGFNFCRQVQIGVEAAKTKFVISAESDCIYPPDYFEVRPEMDSIPYRNTNIYVQKYRKDYACKKHTSTFAQVVGRDFYLRRLKYLFEGQPKWSMELTNFPKEIGKPLFEEFIHYKGQNPCLSMKTGRGMRKHSHTDEIPVYELPYWGNLGKLFRKIHAL